MSVAFVMCTVRISNTLTRPRDLVDRWLAAGDAGDMHADAVYLLACFTKLDVPVWMRKIAADLFTGHAKRMQAIVAQLSRPAQEGAALLASPTRQQPRLTS